MVAQLNIALTILEQTLKKSCGYITIVAFGIKESILKDITQSEIQGDLLLNNIGYVEKRNLLIFNQINYIIKVGSLRRYAPLM